MRMTDIELSKQRWKDRRVERACRGCPERGTSYSAAFRAEMEGEEVEDGKSQ